MKTLLLSLIFFVSVAQASPTPQFECESIGGLTFTYVTVPIKPDTPATSKAIVQVFNSVPIIIPDVYFFLPSNYMYNEIGYAKQNEFRLSKVSIDGESHGWSLSVSALGITDLPMSCK